MPTTVGRCALTHERTLRNLRRTMNLTHFGDVSFSPRSVTPYARTVLPTSLRSAMCTIRCLRAIVRSNGFHEVPNHRNYDRVLWCPKGIRLS